MMPKLAKACLLLICLSLMAAGLCGQSLDAPSLASALDKLMSSSLIKDASLAVAFYSPRDSSLVYGHRIGSALVPASLQKLYTGIAALETFGPDYRFQTQIGSRGSIDGKVLRGDVVVIGGGDPSWSEDFYPEGPHRVFELWADSLRALGISRVEGDLVGDISLHPTYPYSPFWEKTDLAYGWAPAVAALSFNSNLLRFDLKGASRPGKKAWASSRHGYQYSKVSNQITTVAQPGTAAIWLSADPDGRGITLQGKLGVNTPEYLTAAVRNPPLFTLEILRQTLRAKGIRVSGPTRLETDPATSDSLTVLLDFASVPLDKILAVMLKNSSNMLAEALLCALKAGRDSSAVYLEQLFSSHGLPADQFQVLDGSGLARQNLCSASHLGLALCHAWQQDWFPVFLDALARPGEEGTLKKRYPDLKGKDLLYAKTGTLRDVSNLAGYLRAADGELYAFVIICNKVGSIANAKTWQASVCDLLLRFDGGQ